MFFLVELETSDRDSSQGTLSGEITQKGIGQGAAVYSLGCVLAAKSQTNKQFPGSVRHLRYATIICKAQTQ